LLITVRKGIIKVYKSTTELPNMGHCVNHYVSVSMRYAFLGRTM